MIKGFMIDGYYPTEPTEYLKLELEFRKRKNPLYSIRAFARDLNLSPSHLSEVLSGKALLSAKKVDELGKCLRLSPDQMEHWIDLLCLNSKEESQRKIAQIKLSKRKKDSKSNLSLEAFTAVADWYHFAILTFFGVCESYSERELSQFLGVEKEAVQKAIKRLIKVDLLEKSEKGYRPKTESTFTGDTVPSEAVRESQRQILEKTKESLDKVHYDDRENQSLFFSIPKDRVSDLHKELKKTIFETLTRYSCETPAASESSKEHVSIQTLSWHMFPLKG